MSSLESSAQRCDAADDSQSTSVLSGQGSVSRRRFVPRQQFMQSSTQKAAIDPDGFRADMAELFDEQLDDPYARRSGQR